MSRFWRIAASWHWETSLALADLDATLSTEARGAERAAIDAAFWSIVGQQHQWRRHGR